MTARTEWLVIGGRWLVEEDREAGDAERREGATRGEGPQGSAISFPRRAWEREQRGGRQWLVVSGWWKRNGGGETGRRGMKGREAEPRQAAFPRRAWEREPFLFEFSISNLEFRISSFDHQPITNGTIASRNACNVKYPKNAQAQIIITKRKGPIATPRLRILLFMYNRIAQ